MNRELTVILGQLIHGNRIAALGTLHHGVPFVSMVTYAVGKSGNFILHVSRLAAHTQDMLDHPEVSLLITEAEASGKMPQALARVTVEGQAERLDHDSEENSDAQASYLWRFPDATPLFEFSDFDIFVIKPVSARFIAGFGQALTLAGVNFATVLSEAI